MIIGRNGGFFVVHSFDIPLRISFCARCFNRYLNTRNDIFRIDDSVVFVANSRIVRFCVLWSLIRLSLLKKHNNFHLLKWKLRYYCCFNLYLLNKHNIFHLLMWKLTLLFLLQFISPTNLRRQIKRNESKYRTKDETHLYSIFCPAYIVSNLEGE